MKDPIDYSAVLADLEARREKLDQVIAALRLLSGEQSVAIGVNKITDTQIQPDTFVGMSIIEAASRYLHMTGRPAKETGVIADALNRGGLVCTQNSVSALLRRANNAGEGDVIRVGRGLWGLQEWYPARPRRTRQNNEERSGEESE